METYKILRSYTEDQLIEIFKNKENYKNLFTEINFVLNKKSLSFKFEKFTYIIFLKKIQILIYDKNKKISTDVRTNIDLKNFLLQYNFDIKKTVVIKNNNEEKLEICLNHLDFFINDDDSIELKTINIDIPTFIFNKDCISIDENLSPKDYSKFFYDYFPNIKEIEKNEIFNYSSTSKRVNIVINFFKLMNEQNIKKYKITGPLSSGKSMTLFKISLAYKNIIYINIKTLKNNKSNLNKCLEIIFSACSRVYFKESEQEKFKQELEKIDLTQNIFRILLEILNLIMLTINDYIYLILDQLKTNNIINYNEFNNSIEEMMKKKLKVIYCSSVNDIEMREKLIQTFVKYRGNPTSLSSETQDYFFYYSELYIPKQTKSLSFKLFKDIYNYSRLFDEDNLTGSLQNINSKITTKLNNFKVNSNQTEITNNDYNLCDILLLLKKFIYKEQEMSCFINIISICPFKYFIIDIKNENNTFMIIPIFPYMEYFINVFVKYKECEDYFSKEKYNINSFLSNKVKGEYFEYSAKIGIKEKLKFNEKIEEDIFVDQIAEMNRITNDFEEFLLEIKENEKKFEKVNEEEEEEEEEEKDEEEEEKDEEYKKIKQNLDSEINEEEIENKIRNYFKKEYHNFEIEKNLSDEKEKIIKEAKLFGIKINEREKNEIKEIEDYRKEEMENYVIKRKKEIIKLLKIRKKKNKKIKK